MDCYGFETLLEELERDLPLPADMRTQALQHAESCAYCRGRLAAARLLFLELQALAREDESLQAPPHVEARLMAAFRGRSRRASGGWRKLGWAGAAAAVAVAIWLMAAYSSRRPGSTSSTPTQARKSAPLPKPPVVEIASSASVAKPAPGTAKGAGMAKRPVARSSRSAGQTAAEMAGDFIALSGSPYPMGDGVVVRVQVPRSAPALVGLPVSGGDFSGTVTADVVLGEDGVARGIRFVQPQEPETTNRNSVFQENW